MLASLLFTLTFSTSAMSLTLSLMHNSTTFQTSSSAAFPAVRGVNHTKIASYSSGSGGLGIGTNPGFRTLATRIPTVVSFSGNDSSVTSRTKTTLSGAGRTAHVTETIVTTPGLTATSDANVTTPVVSISTTLSAATSTTVSSKTTTHLPSVEDPWTWPATASVEFSYTWSTTTREYWTTLPSQQIPNPFFTNSGNVVSTFTGDPNLSGAPPKATQQASSCEIKVCPPGSFDCHCPQNAGVAPSPTSLSNLPSCSDVVCPLGSVDCCIEE